MSYSNAQMPSIEFNNAMRVISLKMVGDPVVLRHSHLDTMEPMLLAKLAGSPIIHFDCKNPPREIDVKGAINECISKVGTLPVKEEIDPTGTKLTFPVLLMTNGHRLAPELMDVLHSSLSSLVPVGSSFPWVNTIFAYDPSQPQTSASRLLRLNALLGRHVLRLSPLTDPTEPTSYESPRVPDITYLSLCVLMDTLNALDTLDALNARSGEKHSYGNEEHGRMKHTIGLDMLLGPSALTAALGYNWPGGSSELYTIMQVAGYRALAEWRQRAADDSVAEGNGNGNGNGDEDEPTGTKTVFVEAKHLPHHVTCRPIVNGWMSSALDHELSPYDVWYDYILYAYQRVMNNYTLADMWKVSRGTANRWLKQARTYQENVAAGIEFSPNRPEWKRQQPKPAIPRTPRADPERAIRALDKIAELRAARCKAKRNIMTTSAATKSSDADDI